MQGSFKKIANSQGGQLKLILGLFGGYLLWESYFKGTPSATQWMLDTTGSFSTNSLAIFPPKSTRKASTSKYPSYKTQSSTIFRLASRRSLTLLPTGTCRVSG